MSKICSIYIVLWLLIQLLIEINCQTATLIDDKLYIVDGRNFNKKFIYLDVSTPFNTQNISWHELTTIVPEHVAAASVKGGENNKILFLYGGSAYNGAVMALVYAFNTQNNSWSIPKLPEGIIMR